MDGGTLPNEKVCESKGTSHSTDEKSKTGANSAAVSDGRIDIARLGELAQMIDLCLLLIQIQSRPAIQKGTPPGQTGISRMSTGPALQQAHGYQSFQMHEDGQTQQDQDPVSEPLLWHI